MDQLDLLASLREVRLTGNPVLALSKSGGRFEAIGRIRGLALLNGAEVRASERRDAEVRYLRYALTEIHLALDEEGKGRVKASHPRLPELMEAYGSEVSSAGPQMGGPMVSSLIDLKLTCVSTATQAKMGTQEKKLPKSITIGAIKLLCEKLFKVKVAHMTLLLRVPGEPFPEDIGSQEDATLSAFNLQEGVEVLVDEYDPEERKKKEDKERDEMIRAREMREEEQRKAADRVAQEVAKAMVL